MNKENYDLIFREWWSVVIFVELFRSTLQQQEQQRKKEAILETTKTNNDDEKLGDNK